MAASVDAPVVLTRVHLLLQVDPGAAQAAAQHVGGLPAVEQAVATTGSYDVIATVGVGSDRELSAVLAQVRRTPGLCALRMCRASVGQAEGHAAGG